MAVARICLFLAWFFSFFFIGTFEFISAKPPALRYLLIALFMFVYGLVLYFLDKWKRSSRIITIPQRILKIKNKKLGLYTGVHAFIHWDADDRESINFMESLSTCLARSGWVAHPTVGHHADGSVANVIIEVNQIGDMADEAATLLGQLLKKSKIDVIIMKNERNPLPKDSMYIRIGPIRA